MKAMNVGTFKSSTKIAYSTGTSSSVMIVLKIKKTLLLLSACPLPPLPPKPQIHILPFVLADFGIDVTVVEIDSLHRFGVTASTTAARPRPQD